MADLFELKIIEPDGNSLKIDQIRELQKRIQEKQLSVFRMVETWGCECFQTNLPTWQVANINTQEEYEKLIKRV